MNIKFLKSITVVGFFTFLLLAASYLYLASGDNIFVRDNSNTQVRISLKDATVERYDKGALVSRAHASQVYFYQDNHIDLVDEVHFERSNGPSKEFVQSNHGKLFLADDKFINMINGSEVEKAIFTGNTLLQSSDYTIKTNVAHVDVINDIIYGSEEVEMTSSKKQLYGTDGFVLNNKNQTLEVLGKVKGRFNTYAQEK